MKPTFKEVTKAFLRFCVELPLEILSFVISPFALLFCKKEDEHLPKIFIWFDELRWGINGDNGWKKDHFPEPTNRTYWARCRWLWRNRINGFQMLVTGCNLIDALPLINNTQGDPDATDKIGATCYIKVLTSFNKEYFSYYTTKKWCKWFYIRIYIGHKFMDFAGQPTEKIERRLYESVFSIHPFKRVSSF